MQGASVGVEGVEGADERVARIESGILLVQQQGKAIGLVAVKAVISAQGEIQPQDQAISQPPGRSRHGLRWAAPVRRVAFGISHSREFAAAPASGQRQSGADQGRRLRD